VVWLCQLVFDVIVNLQTEETDQYGTKFPLWINFGEVVES
jgi:hypothetical protein